MSTMFLQTSVEPIKSEILEDQQEMVSVFGNDNPLANSSSYEVYLKDVTKQSEMVSFIESLSGVRKVNSAQRRNRLRKL